MFDCEFWRSEWPVEVFSWIMFGVALLFFLINEVIHMLQFYALKRREPWEFEKKERFDTPEEGVSVIITVNNSVAEIETNLTYLMEQDYPNYEVVIVDEISEDNTLDVLTRFKEQYPNIHITRLFPGVKFHRTKKIALNIGVLAAKYDILLFTDISCVPASKNWIRSMQSCFSRNTVAVLGMSVYKNNENRVDIYRYIHNLHTLKMLFMHLLHVNVAVDPVNYAYRKSMYLEVRGFSENNQEIDGYEREIIMKLKGKGEIRYNRDLDSYILHTTNDHNVKHAELEYYYIEKRHWGIVNCGLANVLQINHLFLYGTVAYLFFLGFPIWFVLLLVFLIFCVDLVVVNLQLRHLSQKKLFITSLVSNSMCFCARWFYELNSIFTARRWR